MPVYVKYPLQKQREHFFASYSASSYVPRDSNKIAYESFHSDLHILHKLSRIHTHIVQSPHHTSASAAATRHLCRCKCFKVCNRMRTSTHSHFASAICVVWSACFLLYLNFVSIPRTNAPAVFHCTNIETRFKHMPARCAYFFLHLLLIFRFVYIFSFYFILFRKWRIFGWASLRFHFSNNFVCNSKPHTNDLYANIKIG